MKCPSCYSENDDRLKYCEDCGTSLARACPACGAPVRLFKKYCGECGTSLDTASSPRFASPKQYTPKHLAERILVSKDALEGERKYVTVLFADLKGSMELLADRDPEEARKLLDPVLERMIEAVHCYEGTVNQVMGDGIMALFGAPIAQEDHAVHACYAALRMLDSVGKYGVATHRSGATPAQIRVGLNTGEVVVRAIGSDLHMDYTAVGQTTHLAARMEQTAKPGTALITRETLKLVQGYVDVAPLGPVPVKGVIEPVEVFQLAGSGPARTRFQAAVARGLTRFVGRQAELEHLLRALRLANDRHGQVVAVVGEAGLGKSRLLFEFTHSHHVQGWLVLACSAVSHGGGTPYLPIIELLKSYFKIQDRDEHSAIYEKVTGKLVALDRSLLPMLPAFLALLDLPAEDPQWEALDPVQRRQRTLDAVKNLLLRESQVQPLLLVFEDLHWIDSETQVLLDGLLDRLPAARVVVLVNYRPEYQHTWGGRTYYSQLRLDAFAADTAEELLEELLGSDASLRSLKRMLVESTDGNPFFLEESVRSLVETGALIGGRGDYHLADAMREIRIPDTVQAVLAARIDRITPEHKRLLQTAAVIGKDIPLRLLRAVADLAEDDLLRRLADLQAAEFLYETNLLPDLAYTFKHALTHDVAYQGILEERRRSLHARIVEAIEHLYSERVLERTEELAHHAVHGELWNKAVHYLKQSGIKALTRSAYREAMKWLESALATVEQLPEGRERTELRVEIRFDLRNALWPQGKPAEASAELLEAQADINALGDPRRLARLHSYQTAHSLACGTYAEGIESGRRALTAAVEVGDRALEAVACQYLGSTHFAVGEFEQANSLLRRCTELVAGELATQRLGQLTLPSVLARAWLAWTLAETGQFDKARACAAEALDIATAVNQPWSVVFACLGTGVVQLRRGEVTEAAVILQRAHDLCERSNIRLWSSFAAAQLGYAYALSGRVEEGVGLLEGALTNDSQGGLVYGRALTFAYAAEAYLLAGRTDKAFELGARALETSTMSDERGHEAWSLRVCAMARASLPQLGEAEDFYCRSLALARKLGMRPLAAHCELELGRLFARSGEWGKAKEQLSAARLALREMQMTRWIANAETELSRLVQQAD
jgi:class 3 adenylate cyclase/tetratricopeptide (TPR) repeat protein